MHSISLFLEILEHLAPFLSLAVEEDPYHEDRLGKFA